MHTESEATFEKMEKHLFGLNMSGVMLMQYHLLAKNLIILLKLRMEKMKFLKTNQKN